MEIPASHIAQYQNLFDTAKIKDSVIKTVDAVANRIARYKDVYMNLQNQTGVPWFFIGLIHHMESGNDFTKHLHNGDPLTAKTVNHPAGYPQKGNPPFSFEESAIDAIKYQQLDKVKKWDVTSILYHLELFNGPGYIKAGINSPYLWAGSQHYVKGKYGEDHKFNPNLVSKQIGTALILKRIMQRNNLLSVAVGSTTSILLLIGLFFLIKNVNSH